ncbi:N-(5'-phosphoribosyl)anthranilate isomerase [Maribius pontilimi]|uniref:N-(5'-phosphoribosyl)anthranilate isomerase n=1 Tax=Palleronia pontilimi TaxID=1964209 RepID=A0A934MEB6_9RHOB|nr:N-(5'-phosphoribosyl)anthranilate isomerase [Palleronia pontilimi]MBJ3763291.1 N-(5'-phosphoribosyl)anthranilate isomerase [Palleronia pontilimi]
MSVPTYLSPDAFLADLFKTRSARRGGIVRRQRRDIERYVGLEPFLQDMRRRGFTVVANADQLVIFCNREPLRRLT